MFHPGVFNVDWTGGLFFARPFILLLAPGATAVSVDLSVQYLHVFAVFAPLIPIYFAVDNYLRACGKEKLSMVLGVISQLLNVGLDFLLIAVFHKGIRAAALTSCISVSLGSIVMLCLFMGRRMDVYYTRPVLSLSSFLHIIANGSSEFFSSIAMSVMSVVMNRFLLRYGGITAVAAFSIVMYVDSIIGMLNFGICDSLQPAISYCYGAGALERMKQNFRIVLVATVSVSAAAFLFMRFIGPLAAALFIQPGDENLKRVSIAAVRIFSYSYLVGWIDMCFSSYFTALDRPGRSLVVAFSGTLIFPVFCLALLTRVFGLNGVWLTPSVSAVASGILTLILAGTMHYPVQNTYERD